MSKTVERKTATVIAITDRELELEVCRPEACGHCKAKSVCAAGGEGGHRLTLANDGQGYAVGEQVGLLMRRSIGLKAVAIAYLLPVVLMMASLFLLQSIGLSETLSGLAVLGLLAVYFLLLRLFRARLQRNITIEIEKTYDPSNP